MPTLMPSLLKYFLTVGAILFVGLVGLNAVLEPGGPGLRMVQDSPKGKLVRHDPRASLVERLREEEAAQTASGKAEAKPVQTAPAAISTSPTAPAPAEPIVTKAVAATQPQPPQPQPVQQANLPVAPAQVQAPTAAVEHPSTPAALTGVSTEDETRATRIAHEKAAYEKARKKRLARERARPRPSDDASPSRRQDQYYYAQRAPAYAYAPPPPRPAFGPFSQAQNGGGGWFGGGWGRGW